MARAAVGLADPALPGEQVPFWNGRQFVVFRTSRSTGLSAATCRRIVEIGVQCVVVLEAVPSFETLVNPGLALPPAITALTGISALRRCGGRTGTDLAVRRFLEFAGDAVLVAHNARFDMAFLDRAVERLTGRRVAAPVVDTVWLARRLLERPHEAVRPRARSRTSSGRRVEPCHRALADAEATAEILIALIGLAQERGAETVADLVELSAPRARRLHAKRSLVAERTDDAGHLRVP